MDTCTTVGYLVLVNRQGFLFTTFYGTVALLVQNNVVHCRWEAQFPLVPLDVLSPVSIEMASISFPIFIPFVRVKVVLEIQRRNTISLRYQSFKSFFCSVCDGCNEASCRVFKLFKNDKVSVSLSVLGEL